MSSTKTSPDVIMSSAKSFGSIPISSCLWRSMPDFCNSSMESGEYMSSLDRGQDVLGERKQHLLHAEVEVELPCRDILRIVPILVRECDADLYYLEQVDITSHRLVVVIGGRLERANRARNDTRKFGILRGRE